MLFSRRVNSDTTKITVLLHHNIYIKTNTIHYIPIRFFNKQLKDNRFYDYKNTNQIILVINSFVF